VGFVVGGVGVAVGAVLLAIRKPTPKQPTAVGMGPAVTPGGASLKLQGTW
jgi:hypothetical protein